MIIGNVNDFLINTPVNQTLSALAMVSPMDVISLSSNWNFDTTQKEEQEMERMEISKAKQSCQALWRSNKRKWEG